MCARLSQNNSQVKSRVIRRVIQVFYKSSLMSYIRLHIIPRCFARLFNLCQTFMSALAHLVKTYNIFSYYMISYYIFSYYMFSDSVQPLAFTRSRRLLPCYSITFQPLHGFLYPMRLFSTKGFLVAQQVFGYSQGFQIIPPIGFLDAQWVFV